MPDDTPIDRLRAPAARLAGTLTVTDVRRLWPEVLEEVKGRRRFTWILLSQNAHVVEIRDGVLMLAMAGVGARDSFAKGGSSDVLREAMIEVLGADLRIETMVDPGVSGAPAPRVPAPPTTSPTSRPPRLRAESREQARQQVRPTKERQRQPAEAQADERDADAHPDEPVLEAGGESHTELLARQLGAQIIAEEQHDA